MPRGIKGPSTHKSNGDEPKKRARKKKPVDILSLVQSLDDQQPASKRVRKQKTAAQGGVKDEEAVLAAAEAELIKKYPDRRIVPGSILPTGAVKDFAGRRTVVIKCAECGGERRVCTSDVFHVSKCHVCSRKHKFDKKVKEKNEKKGNGKKNGEE